MQLDSETDADVPTPGPAPAPAPESVVVQLLHQGASSSGPAGCRQSHTDHKALYLAIAKFISNGPCTAASQALISEMQTNGVSTYQVIFVDI